MVRQWVNDDEDDVLAVVHRIGAKSIGHAAESCIRLDRVSCKQITNTALAALDELAADLSMSSQEVGKGFFKRTTSGTASLAKRVSNLVENLSREFDILTLSAIELKSTTAKVREAEAALQNSRTVIVACTIAVAAAAREISIDRPDRADFFRHVVTPRLQERERDILMQIAITQQAILTLQILADSQNVLNRAIIRARDISIAALRTTMAARRSVDDATELPRRSEKIERFIDASPKEATSAREVGADLQQALREARLEIDIAESRWPSPL